MKFFRKVKQKIDDGWLTGLAAELRWVWRYVRTYRWVVAVHIALGAVGTLFALAGSVATKFLVDAVTGVRAGAVGAAVGWMVGLMLGNIAMKLVSGRIAAALNIKVHDEIQQEVYRAILSADWQALEPFRSGDLLQRLGSDVGAVAGGVIGFVPALVSGVVQFFGALGIILYYDPVMALIVFVSVPLSALGSRLVVGHMRTSSVQVKERSDELISFQQDSFRNLTLIKAFAFGDLFCGRLSALQRSHRETWLGYQKLSLYTSAFLSLLGLAVSLGCLGWSAYLLWEGEITFGTMTLFFQLASFLSSAVSALIALVPTLISLTTSAGRIMAVTELPGECAEDLEGFCGEEDFDLLLDDIRFSYHTGEQVLSGATIHARSGDLVALTGPSGEGKTTLLRILLGLVTPEEGRARLVGKNGREYPLSAATRTVFGYVPQGESLFSGTIEENLRMAAPAATEEQLWAALETACAADFVRALPDGLRHRVGDRDSGLSEGQGQRLAVARALLKGSPILLLDEATSALDEATEHEMLRRVMGSGMTRTCILVTHRSSAQRHCTRSYHVVDGRVSEEEIV